MAKIMSGVGIVAVRCSHAAEIYQFILTNLFFVPFVPSWFKNLLRVLCVSAVILFAGCQLALIPVFVVERLEDFKRNRPATRPWHFEGERVVYER